MTKQYFFIFYIINYELIAFQQQHSFHVQLGHSLVDLLSLHSEGKQPQSAHFISAPISIAKILVSF